jgi:hypothetical protein
MIIRESEHSHPSGLLDARSRHEGPALKLTRRIGLFAGSLGWHRGPYGEELRRAGVPPAPR